MMVQEQIVKKRETLTELCRQEPRVRFAYSFAGFKIWVKFDKQNPSYKWNITLKCEGRRMRVSFYQTWDENGAKPSVPRVLSSLLSDARAGEMSFYEFCNEFGYDTDNRSAIKTWRACARFVPRLQKLLGDRYERFCQAEVA